MPIDSIIRATVETYVGAHLPKDNWYHLYFSFIKDSVLADRLADEFRSARYIYKTLEALEAKDWLQRAQIRVQILQYASIYEAVIHYVLFDLLCDEPKVKEIREYTKLTRISIPAASLSAIAKCLSHDSRFIIPMYEAPGVADLTKVRFDAKAGCAESLGLIDEGLRDDLIEFYEARNAIHIHAEIRKSLDYQLDLSRRAYRRMRPFRRQVIRFLAARGL